MKRLRKSSVIAIVFLGIWLWTAFAYTMQVDCSCCSHKEGRHHCCNKKGLPEQLSHENKNDHENNHCHQESNDCSCIKCGNYDNREALFSKIYFEELKKQHLLTLEQNILGNSFLSTESIITRPENTFPLKFLSLFLLKSSFLI